MKQGIFGSTEKDGVQPLVHELKKAGFTDLDISVMVPKVHEPKDMDLLPNAARGAVAGGALGVAAAEAAALAATFLIPGVGPILATGPALAALAGASVGGVIGGLSGATGYSSWIVGIPQSVVEKCEADLKAGKGLVMVDCDTPESEAKANKVFRRMKVPTHRVEPEPSSSAARGSKG